MAPYFIIFAILAFCSLLDIVNVRREQKSVVLLLCWLLLTCFAGLRYDSPDYMPYWEGFEEVSEFGLDYSALDGAAFFEPGYNFLVWAVSRIIDNPVAMFVAIAAIAVGLNLSFYKRYSPYFLLAVLLYFSHTFLMRETMQIRAGVAAAITLWALPYAEQRKIWKFSLLVLLAMTFHMASITAALLYVAYRLDWSRKTWSILVCICLVIGITFPFGKLLSALPSGGLFDRLLVYSWMVESNTSSGVLTNPTIVKQLFLCIIGLKYWGTLSEKVPHFKLLFVPLLLSVCWLMVWNDFPIVAGRMGTFLSITEVMVAPMLLYLVKPDSKIIMGTLIIIYALLTLSLNLMVKNVLPYQFILAQ